MTIGLLTNRRRLGSHRLVAARRPPPSARVTTRPTRAAARHVPGLAKEPDNPLLQPRVLAAQHLLRDAIDRAVILAVEVREVLLHATTGFAAEEIGEIERFLLPVLRHHVRAHARRRDREQFGANVDGAE